MSVEFSYAHAAANLRRNAIASHRSDRSAREETELRLRVLGLPFGVERHALPDSVQICPKSEIPDFVILGEPNAAALLSRSLQPALSAILPVVDATCQPGCEINRRRSDISIGTACRHSISFAGIMLSPMIARLHELPSSLMESQDARLWLLARLFVRNRGLKPRRDPAAKEVIVYNDDSAIPRASMVAEGLVKAGLLERRFYDALTICPHCESARLIVRERCVTCGSAHLIEQPVLHHMRCAYQGPEEDFRVLGGDLVCPKCRQRLQQFSLDYDRPGRLYTCRDCGHSSGDTSISFLCLDCEADVPAVHTATRAAYDYGLTQAGRACVLSGTAITADPGSSHSLTDRVCTFMRSQLALGQSFCILRMRLLEPPSIPAGGRIWQQTCAFFGSLIRECFIPETEIIEGSSAFFVLLARDTKAEVEKALPEIRARLERHLALAPEVEYSVYAPDEFLAFAGLMSVE